MHTPGYDPFDGAASRQLDVLQRAVEGVGLKTGGTWETPQPLLEICNSLTRDNPLFPAFLHDAEAGWDVLLSARVSVEVLVSHTAFFRLLLEHGPGMAELALERFAAEGISTTDRHKWSEDVPRLITRSVM